MQKKDDEVKKKKFKAMKLFQVLFAIFAASVLIQCGVAQTDDSRSPSERAALIDLRSSLGLKSSDWPIKNGTCQWRGVECDDRGRVLGIDISGFGRTRVGQGNPRFAVDSLQNLTVLNRFNASGFPLPGSIPDWFGEKLGALQVLDLRNASIVGSIPSSLGGLAGLRSLLLAGNDLSGGVPSSLAELSELVTLDLSRNSLTGSVPAEFSSLKNLTVLDLSSNFFSGEIPSELSKISGLQVLNLADNSFTGPVPAQFQSFSDLRELNLSKNFLSGTIPRDFRLLGNLRTIDFSENGMVGLLPEDLFLKLSHLRRVVLSGNNFQGRVSGEFWSLPNLDLLDVSRNNLTGNLPSFAGNQFFGSDSVFNLSNNFLYGNLSTFMLVKSGSIDLSGNYLQGSVPDTRGNASLAKNCLQFDNQRSSEDCQRFYESKGLTFDIPVTPETIPTFLKPDPVNKKKLTFVMVGVFGGIGFIVILVTILVLILKCRGKETLNRRSVSNVGPDLEEGGAPPTLQKDPSMYLSGLGDSFTYNQILQYTTGFSDASLVKHGHSGDIFKGYLENGTPIVIKRVDLRSGKSEASYVTELELVSKVSHARLVPLLGHCLENESEKFLVYKHMPNGDLASSLHRVTIAGKDGLQSMDWITRLKIATGTAEFLAYLHHECSPPLVHRDIQASSILLDDKYEVRIGSLSEIRAHESDASPNVITRLLRKPQTLDQISSETALTICAHDVYCFGKVLLELVTGKLGISRSDDANTGEWLEQTLRHVNIYDKEYINKIIDPSLILDDDLLDEVWAMSIVARSCLLPKPSRRPLMKHVLKALENPLKVVRVESSNSERLRTTSSRVSWSAAFLGSWRHSSSENARENMSSFKQTTRMGSQGSGSAGVEHSSSLNKRLSSEIFPEPVEAPDLERQSEN